MKHKQWSVKINGQEHIIEFKGHGIYSYYILYVDGTRHAAYSSHLLYQLVDYRITFEDVPCHFIVFGPRTDLVVDGKYLESGKDYEPFSRIPSSVNALAILSPLTGFILQGIWGVLLGVVLGYLYYWLYLEQKKSKTVFLAFAATSAVQFILRILLLVKNVLNLSSLFLSLPCLTR